MTLTPEQERDFETVRADLGYERDAQVESAQALSRLRSDLEQRTLERDVLGDELKRVQDERYKYRSELEAARADVETAAAAADEWKRKALSNPLRSDLEAKTVEVGNLGRLDAQNTARIATLEADLEAARGALKPSAGALPGLCGLCRPTQACDYHFRKNAKDYAHNSERD